MTKFAKGDRVRIVRIIITHEDQIASLARTVECLGKIGTVGWVGSQKFPYHVEMDDKELRNCYWREEELERV